MPTKQHIPALDGLRALAVLLVLGSHIPEGSLGERFDIAKSLLNPGAMGVDVFFVLSGFLITRILIADRDEGAPLRWFWARRFLRIFPIYYLTLLVLSFAAPDRALPWCFAYLSNFLFVFDHTLDLSPVRHTWSLAIEEHFYLLWPLLVYALRSRRALSGAALGCIALALASGAAALVWLPGPVGWRFVHESSGVRAASLLVGGLLAIHEERALAFARHTWAVLLFGACSLAALAWLKLPPSPAGVQLWVEIASTCWSSALLLLALGSCGRASVAGGLLSLGALRYVGRISYGLYLYHVPLFHLFGMANKGAGPVSGSAVLGAFASAFAVATLSYYAIERPLLRYQARFRVSAATV